MLVHLGPDSLGGGLGWSELGAGSITGSGEGRGGSYQEKKREEIRRYIDLVLCLEVKMLCITQIETLQEHLRM